MFKETNFTQLESFNLSYKTAKSLYERSQKGRVQALTSRTIGATLLALASIIDTLAHFTLASGKLAAATLLLPYRIAVFFLESNIARI